MTELTERAPETIDTLVLTNSQFERLSPRAREIMRNGGLPALRQTAAMFRDAATIERSEHEMNKWAEKNAERDAGVIHVESTSEVVDVSAEIEALRAENEDLAETVERLKRTREELLIKLAESAMATDAKGTAR